MARRAIRAGSAVLVALALLAAPPAGGQLADLDPEYGIRPPRAGVRKQAWERARGGRELARADVQRRLEGWPTRLLGDREELLGLPGDALLERVAADTWRGVSALTDAEHGLPVNHVLFAGGSLAPRDADVGDYASTTDVGMYLVAVVAARELGLVAPAQAQERVQRTLDTLDRLEKREGFFFNYYDTTTLERTSDFVSFVDSAWLAAGLIAVRQEFPALWSRCTTMLAHRDFRHFYDPRERLMVHGVYVDPLRRSPYHYGTLYTEARIGSLIAIGKGDVPASHWAAMSRIERWSRNGRPVPPKARGARPPRRSTPLQRTPSGWFEWQGYRYVPSWGGSMFEALMPVLVVDEPALAPESLGGNARVHVAVQERYAREHLGYPVWGMSPSWRPDERGYQEYGARVLGIAGYPAGAVTPHAAALALAVAPEEAGAVLRELIRRYPVYGEFGFYDSVDPRTGQVAHAYLALDQAMLLIALANHLRDGAVQRRFAADPILRRALPLLEQERFPNPGPHPPPVKKGAGFDPSTSRGPG